MLSLYKLEDVYMFTLNQIFVDILRDKKASGYQSLLLASSQSANPKNKKKKDKKKQKQMLKKQQDTPVLPENSTPAHLEEEKEVP